MEKRKFPRILLKIVLYLIMSFLFYVIVIGSFVSYYNNSETLWFPIFQTILFVSIVYFLMRKIINVTFKTLYHDFLYLFVRKKIKIVKEDKSYSIVKVSGTIKLDAQEWLATNLTKEQAIVRLNTMKSQQIRELRLKKLKKIEKVS